MCEKNITDIVGLGKGVEKLVGVTERAGIGFFKSWQIKRGAKAQAKAIETLSPTVRANIDIPMTIESYGLTIDTTEATAETLEGRAMLRFAQQETKRQENIEMIVGKAAEIIEDTENISDEKPDDDWVTRFFNYAQDVSDEAMRLLWSRLLAGEAARPNSFSLKTLDVLRNLSKQNAEHFVEISNYVFDRLVIPVQADIKYYKLLELDDAGLLNCTRSSLKIDINPFLTYWNYCVKIEPSSNKFVDFEVYPLTTAGKELSKLLSTTANIDFIKRMSENLKEKGYSVSYSEITKFNKDDTYEYKKPMIEL